MIDSLRVFSFSGNHPPQCPPHRDAIDMGKQTICAVVFLGDTSQRCAGTNLQKRHNLHRSQQKKPHGFQRLAAAETGFCCCKVAGLALVT